MQLSRAQLEAPVADAAVLLATAPAPLLHAERVKAHPAVNFRLGFNGGGRGLYAEAPASPGTVLVTERAVLWQRGDEAGGVFCAPGSDLQDVDRVMLQMAPLCLTPDMAAAGVPLPGMTRKHLAHVTMQANCFELQAKLAAGDAALFPVICLCNHSCEPNATVLQVAVAGEEEGGGADPAPAYTLSARTPLHAGQEVRISYVPRSWPKGRRGAACSELWKFTCSCPRCSVPWDDTLVLRLPCACGAGRAYFPDRPSTLAACLECGAHCDIAGTPLADGDSEATLGDVSVAADATPAALASVAGGLLNHAVLWPDDARVFAVLTALAGHVSVRMSEAPARAEEEGEEGEQKAEEGGAAGQHAALRSLFEALMGAIATAALRSKFVTVQDLGLEVTVE